jgi:hypothetical protein
VDLLLGVGNGISSSLPSLKAPSSAAECQRSCDANWFRKEPPSSRDDMLCFRSLVCFFPGSRRDKNRTSSAATVTSVLLLLEARLSLRLSCFLEDFLLSSFTSTTSRERSRSSTGDCTNFLDFPCLLFSSVVGSFFLVHVLRLLPRVSPGLIFISPSAFSTLAKSFLLILLCIQCRLSGFIALFHFLISLTTLL